MEFNFISFLSILPFLLFLFLLLWKKVPLLWSTLTMFLVILILQIFYWQMIPIYLINSIIKGTLVAFDIFVIILGAIFFLEVLKDIKIIDNVRFFMETFLKDYRVQVILLAWFLENFIEGTAGFGTPSTIVAPLLVSLGTSPLTAVILSLLGNSTSVAFGAAGTPIRVGFEGLNITGVPHFAALFNLVGFLVPVFMLMFITSQQNDRKRSFWEALPFAIWSGIAFVVPSLLIVPLGQEFPSIIGSLVGLGLVLITIRLKIFIPKQIRTLQDTNAPEVKLPFYKIVLPYFLLILLLIVGKFSLGQIKINFPWGLIYNLNLFNPGLAFLFAGLPVSLFWGRKKLTTNSLKIAFRRGLEPFIVIALMSVAAQLIINSGFNLSGKLSLLSMIAKGFEVSFLPFLAPFVGASNIMFGNFLNTASHVMNFDTAKILALGLVGAAAGNMIALADIITAEAVVGLHNKTRFVLKAVIIPCLIYLIIVGFIGLLVI